MSKEPAGSLAPMDSQKGRWHEHVDAAALGTLEALAVDIDKTIKSTVTTVARAQIKVGKLLAEAYKEFDHADTFKKWRIECTQVKSKQQASYLMQVAEKFGDAPKLVEGVSFSVLRELITAPQEYIEAIEAKVDAGEPTPGALAARQEIKDVKAGVPVSGPKTTIPKPSFKVHKSPVRDIVQQDLAHRADFFEGEDKETSLVEKAYVLFGLDPDPQVPPNREVILAIISWYRDDYTGDPAHLTLLAAAGNLLDEDRENFDDG